MTRYSRPMTWTIDDDLRALATETPGQGKILGLAEKEKSVGGCGGGTSDDTYMVTPTVPKDISKG